MAGDFDRPYLDPPAGPTAISRTTRPLAVLIITYKSHELLEKCLAKVTEHLPELPIYVYENSGDDYPGRQELVARHPYVHWVIGPVNLGFAAAFNALVAHTPPDTDLLMLNPDARLLGPLTATRRLVRQSDVAAVSPLIIDDSAPGPQRWDIATRRRNLIRAVVAAAGYANISRGTWFSYLYAKQPTEGHTVDGYVGGACMAVNRDAWNTIGGFDEEFFLYGEESDWQHRARAAGWRVLLADELGIEHGGDDGDHGPAVDNAERGRGYDLLRAHTALLLEHQYSARHANAYLAATTLLDRVQHSKRRIRRRAMRRSESPHILITTNRLVNEGIDRQKVMLATELQRRGYRVTVVCLQRLGRLVKELPHSVRVVRQPWWAPLVDGPAGPALVISGDTDTEVRFATLWRGGGRGRRWLVAANTPPGPDNTTYSRPLTAAMRRADGVITGSQRHREALTERNGLAKNQFVAPWGVAVPGDPHFGDRPTRQSPHLMTVSRSDDRPGLTLLLDALTGLIEFPWILTIFVVGRDRLDFGDLVPPALRQRVHWHGCAPGRPLDWSDVDLLCVPGRSESFPSDVLEAMARGVPVAASAIERVREILDDGGAGIVVEPVTVHGWREELKRILADRDALSGVGRRGFERVQARYTIEAVADHYLRAVESLL